MVDKSALARGQHDSVFHVLSELAAHGTFYTNPLIDLEMLYSAQDLKQYRALAAVRSSSHTMLPLNEQVGRRALQVQEALAEQGHHRGAGVVDLLIAASAEQAGATLVHYDHDYDLIAEVTQQPMRWVVPRGSIA